jgi:hypothetical protein
MAEMHRHNAVVYAGGQLLHHAYLMLSGTIFLLPELASTGTYRIWYAKKFTPYTALSDAMTDPEGHEEYVVLGVAIFCGVKENTDVTELMAKKQALKARIEGEASNRDAGQPAHVVDKWLDDDDLC